MESAVEYYSIPYLNTSRSASRSASRTASFQDTGGDEDDGVESEDDLDPSIIAPDGLSRRIRRDTLVNPPDVDIRRTALTVSRKHGEFNYAKPAKPGLCESIHQNIKKKTDCSFKRVRNYLYLRLPILDWFFRYKIKNDLFGDVISGITVAVMHIPQGMAYAMLANVDPISGIYMAFFPALIYAVFASSKHNSVGSFAVVCIMSGKVVAELATFPEDVASGSLSIANNSTTTYSPTEVACILSFAVGIWMIIFGVLKLGSLCVLLSDMLISGFTTGAAVHVLTPQIPALFGMKTKVYAGLFNIPKTWYCFAANIFSSNSSALLISIVCIAILVINNVVFKPRLRKITAIPFPIELVILVAATLVSTYCEFNLNYGTKVVGEIPTGLPAPRAPPFELYVKVLASSLTIAIVAFSIAFSLAKTFAIKSEYTVDATQELYAMGLANICGAMFACPPIGVALARSLIQHTVGGATQITSFVSCGLLLLVLLFIGPFFEKLPICVLAAIIVVALKTLFVQFGDFFRMWKVCKLDAFLWIITFLGVVLLDIDYGLLVGIVAALLLLLVQHQSPRITVLGRISDTDIFLDQSRYSKAEEVAGIKICSVFGSLHFANQESFRNNLIKTTGLDPLAIIKWKKKHEKSLERKWKKLSIAESLHDNDFMEDNKSDNTPDVGNWMKSTEVILDADPLQVHFNDLSSQLRSTEAAHDLVSLIIDFSAVSRMDVSAARNLAALLKDYEAAGVVVAFASLSDLCLEVMSKCGASDDLAEEVLFHSVEDAVVFLTTPENTVPDASIHI